MTNVRSSDKPSKCLIVNFHGIGAKPSWIKPDEAHYWCDDIAQFGILLDDIVVARADREIEITFDDGNLSDFEVAVPALVKRGLTASFFICAGRIGSESYVNTQAMRDMCEAGMRIGSHGWAHVDWRKLDELQLKHEVNDASDAIEHCIGKKINGVAIPFGSYSAKVLNHLSRFSSIYTSDGGYASRGKRIIPRESYSKNWGHDEIKYLINKPELSFRSIKRDVSMLFKRHR